jgi:hypothetical protein
MKDGVEKSGKNRVCSWLYFVTDYIRPVLWEGTKPKDG